VETAAIGGTPKGGICRLALSDEDRRVRDWFAAAVRDAGLELAVDAMGSMFAIRPGRDPARAPIAMGSHLDTQPTGGRFDGVLGVLAGLEVMRTLNAAGIETEAPLMLVNWTNEEGARFAPGMVASGVYSGEVDMDFAMARTDRDGIAFGDALDAIGYRGSEPVGRRRFAAMVELHIEQGPILEADGLDIGIVTAGKGSVWADGRVTGRECHAAFALAAEAVAREHGPDGVATIGVAEAFPASRNTVPGEVRFTLEYRHPDLGDLDAMDAAIAAAARRIEGERGVAIDIEKIWRKDPVAFDAGVSAAIGRAASELGLGSRPMTSGAGHDAFFAATVAPTAMIFVPCKDGISHNEAESSTQAECAAGADVLLRTVLALAG
jgi:N-carbamoyl-L-amino-acid hydrolase